MLTAFYLVADGVHQVSLAHSYAAIQEERIVGARRTLSNGQRSCASKLIAVADHEIVERVARVELRCCRPVETRLLWSTRWRRGRSCRRVSGHGAEATVATLRRNRGILICGHK